MKKFSIKTLKIITAILCAASIGFIILMCSIIETISKPFRTFSSRSKITEYFDIVVCPKIINLSNKILNL